MYCRNCGKELIGTPDYCMGCGARPAAGRSFCPNCANPTTPLSEICVKCGKQLTPPVEQTPVAVLQKPAKTRTNAILLAVFLHFWTWVYTYRRDGWKFWVGSGSWVFMILILSAGVGGYAWFIALAIWLWAIVDTALKTDDWYCNYKL